VKLGQVAVSIGLIALFVSCLSAPALACQTPTGERTPVVVQVQFGSLRVPWVVNLTWPGPVSTATPRGTTCAIGLNAGMLTRVLDVEVFQNGSGFHFDAFGQFRLDEAASLAAGERLGGRWLVFTSTLSEDLPADVPVDNAFQAVAPPGTTFRNVVSAYGDQPVFLTGEFDPAAGDYVPEHVHVTAGDQLDFLPGMAREQPTADLIESACNPDLHPNARNAASIAVSTRWLQSPPAREALYRYSADPTRPPECRMMAFEAQVTALFSLGDPRIGPPLGPDTGQRYADAVAQAPTPERAYVLATGVARLVREGFAIVPGGVEESFRRLQTCLLDGRIETSQANRVEGVALDCGVEAGLTYYSMEMIHGMECRKHVLKNGPMPPLLAVRIANLARGAIFNTLESFNGRAFNGLGTSFNQEQAADFIAAGGAFAVGTVYEPLGNTVADNEMLVRNFIVGERTWAEAAWSAVPALSWMHVVLGDPLATIERGAFDVNGDGRADIEDAYAIAEQPSDTDGDGDADRDDVEFLIDFLRQGEIEDMTRGRRR